jgi:hypothetical protein
LDAAFFSKSAAFIIRSLSCKWNRNVTAIRFCPGSLDWTARSLDEPHGINCAPANNLPGLIAEIDGTGDGESGPIHRLPGFLFALNGTARSSLRLLLEFQVLQNLSDYLLFLGERDDSSFEF